MNFISLRIAWRYFRAKNKAGAVNIMTILTAGAIAIGTAAMTIILSVFSGFVNASQSNYSDLNPDIKITALEGKLLPNITFLENVLSKEQEIKSLSKTIEEKVYLLYENKQDIAYLKAVDSAFTNIYPLEKQVYYGNYLDFDENNILVSDTLARRLQISIAAAEPVEIITLRPGNGLLKTEQDLRKQETYISGIFFIPDEKYGQYVFSSLKTAQRFLRLNENDFYAAELKLKTGVDRKVFKEKMQGKLMGRYRIETREDQDAAYLKMLNLENMFVYLILALVIFILTFSLIGVLYVIILDKKVVNKTLWNFGMPLNKIKSIFFFLGLIITLTATFFGVFVGSIVAFVQKQTSVFSPNDIPFPIDFQLFNYIVVLCTVIGMGALVSYVFSRRIVL